MAKEEVLEDPRNYLRILPWDQLIPASWQIVEEMVKIDDPFDDIRENARKLGYMLWKPPNAAFKWLHHLRTEEEVLQYCVSKEWSLPGYWYDEKANQVLFELTPIEDRLFLKQLDKFWDTWVCLKSMIRVAQI
jgi:hypothetical protein